MLICQLSEVDSAWQAKFAGKLSMSNIRNIYQRKPRWWFQTFFIFTPIWGRFPFWLIFFKWVETTNQKLMSFLILLGRWAVSARIFPLGGLKLDSLRSLFMRFTGGELEGGVGKKTLELKFLEVFRTLMVRPSLTQQALLNMVKNWFILKCLVLRMTLISISRSKGLWNMFASMIRQVKQFVWGPGGGNPAILVGINPGKNPVGKWHGVSTTYQLVLEFFLHQMILLWASF